MLIFTIVFGNLARINSDGVPYAIFSYTALVPWTYFSNALSSSSTSLLSSAGILTKVYFPRLIIPLAPVLSKLVDFCIAFIILLVMMIYYNIMPSGNVLLLPYLIILMIITTNGMGMWLTSLAIKYRDINYGMQFFLQLLMYVAPVVYPASNIPQEYRLIYGLFPMSGVIEGFRSILLQTNPIPWDLLIMGTIVSSFIFISGAYYFKRMEKYFADVA
tara:strand:- start:4018 stop:4668 length:651 start_codon:yes stop_codon:yes gene_type:complete